MSTWALFVWTLVASAILTGLVRQYALARNMLDHPSERGLHSHSIPRGGGAAIVLVVSVTMILLVFHNTLDAKPALVWIGCAFGFGLLGWVDDHIDLSATMRFVCQLALAATFCVGSLDNVEHVQFVLPDVASTLFIIGCAVAVVWTVNLFNFMDGADGFAALEAMLVAGFGAAIAAYTGGSDVTLIAALVAGSSAGFLIWNWQPARVFMGDVGSYFLGFQFAALLLHGALVGNFGWVWLILLAPFVTDASLTLIRRIFAREQWWRAHRTHVYQRLILSGWSHARVCVALLAITIGLLVPAAVTAALYPSLAAGMTATIYLLTAIIWTATTMKI